MARFHNVERVGFGKEKEIASRVMFDTVGIIAGNDNT